MKSVLPITSSVALKWNWWPRLIFSKKYLIWVDRMKKKISEPIMMDAKARAIGLLYHGFLRPFFIPRPNVSEPYLLKEIKFSRFWPMIDDGDFDQKIRWWRTTIFDKYIKISTLTENTRVYQFIFWALFPRTVFLQKLLVRKGSLRVFIEHLEIVVIGCGIKIVISLFDVFAMVPLWAR